MTTTAKKIVTAKPVKPVAVVTPPVAPKVTATPPVALAKVAVKAPGRPVAKKSIATAKVAAKPLVKPKVEKPVKVKKPKLVRDSFTIPKAEYTVLDDLKQRAGKLSSAVKKSELIRAGVKALAAMSDAAFLVALKAVPAIKTGRPTNAKAG